MTFGPEREDRPVEILVLGRSTRASQGNFRLTISVSRFNSLRLCLS